MRALVGIGNPGLRYEKTRHNVGFLFLDFLAKHFSVSFKAGKGEFYFAEGQVDDAPFLLVKPTTYVNLSGTAAAEIQEFYDIPVEDFLVVFDDINLPLGTIRVRAKGGDGGHNGIHSMIYHLYSGDFARIRFGIGSEFEKGDMADYVLSSLDEEEMKLFEERFELSVPLAESFIKDGKQALLDENSKLTAFLKKQEKEKEAKKEENENTSSE